MIIQKVIKKYLFSNNKGMVALMYWWNEVSPSMVFFYSHLLLFMGSLYFLCAVLKNFGKRKKTTASWLSVKYKNYQWNINFTWQNYLEFGSYFLVALSSFLYLSVYYCPSWLRLNLIHHFLRSGFWIMNQIWKYICVIIWKTAFLKV